jgi:hypothetical protein
MKYVQLYKILENKIKTWIKKHISAEQEPAFAFFYLVW